MNTVNITKLLDGEREATFHVFIEGDGSADETDLVLIDPTSDVSPALGSVPSFTIEKIWYDLSGFNAVLGFGYLLTGTPIWNLSGNQSNFVCFSEIGGLKDRSGNLDGTGKLTITTRGLEIGDTGSIVIKVRKT